MTTTLLGKVAITPKGAYNPATTYAFLDALTYNGSSYLALQSVTGVLPTDDGVHYQLLAGGSSDTALIEADLSADFVVSGLASPTSATLVSTMTAGAAYVTGTRVASAGGAFTYAASSDTYDDLATDGSVTHVAVANGASAPGITTNTLRLQKVVTNATAVVAVTPIAPVGPIFINVINAQQGINVVTGDASLYVGTAARPHALALPNSVYAVLDKTSTADGAGTILRDNGNARARIGIVGDDNVHVQIGTGSYPSETFTDRLLIRASGQVDSLGTITRAYGATGVPTFACGNTDGSSTGAGLELYYDQTNTLGGINAIDHSANTYRPLKLSAHDISWYVGGATLGANPAAALLNTGVYVVNGGLQISSNATYTNSFAQGMLYKSSANGLVVAPITGSSYDLSITDTSGNNVLTLATGTKNLTTWASLTLAAGTATAGTAPLKFPSGTKLTTPEAGAIEYDGSFWLTDSTGRQQMKFSTPTVGPVSTVTVGASPFVYQNTTGGAVDILLQGTSPSALAFSRDGTTYYALNTSGGGGIGLFMRLSPGDYLKTTYSSTAPTMLLIPR